MKFRALLDTAGMSTPQRAEFWLSGLARACHRGRHDTWTAARERAAKQAKLKPSMAKRIWQRWETMKDVSGDAVLKLMTAYEDMCIRNEEAAEAYRLERLKLMERDNGAVDGKPGEKGLAAHAPGARKAA